MGVLKLNLPADAERGLARLGRAGRQLGRGHGQ